MLVGKANERRRFRGRLLSWFRDILYVSRINALRIFVMKRTGSLRECFRVKTLSILGYPVEYERLFWSIVMV
jgi:hypothetical protein